MKKSSTFFGAALISALTLSGCSVIQSVTSEAYALGLATGQEYAGLIETSNNLQSWIPDEDGAESFSSSQITEDGVMQYCTTIWFAVGIASGLENSDANESDFVSGCLDGAGF